MAAGVRAVCTIEINQPVSGRVVPAFEARQIENRDVGMVGCKIGCPHLLCAIGRVILGPQMRQLQRRFDKTTVKLISVKAVQVRARLGQGSDAQNRITERLKLLQYSVV